MIEICRERAGQGDFRVHDLGDPITWLPGASAGLALCALAIGYVDVSAVCTDLPCPRHERALLRNRQAEGARHPRGATAGHGLTGSPVGGKGVWLSA
jgi:hypothetical protein